MIDFIKNRKIFYIISGILIISSIFVISFWGLKWGVDFKGGSLWEISVPNSLTVKDKIADYLQGSSVGQTTVQVTGEGNLIFRFSSISEEKHQQLLQDLKRQFPDLEEKRFESIGPVIGKELTRKMIWAFLLVVLGILLYLSYSFSQSFHNIPSYKYSLLAILCLVHDTLIVVAVFAVLGRFLNWEVNSDFIVAILTVLGYSVHDTIVVYNKVRENLRLFSKEPLDVIINKSIRQTLIRSINTSLTTIFPLVALFLMGPHSIKALVLAMVVGVIAGTYSSLALATSLLYDWNRRSR
ncbi:protein translocase subunit SecF [bacterium]|nr:protein translocase subunit SecF [bacterium]